MRWRWARRPARFPSPAKCRWSAARRAISFIRPKTASSSPAARSSRNSGSRFTQAIGLPAELIDDARDPKATRAAVAKLIAAQDRGGMAADIRGGRLLRHHRGAAGGGAARSAFRRARPVRARGGERRRARRCRRCRCRSRRNSARSRAPRKAPPLGLERFAAHQPRLRAAGATPSRITARRKGPMRSIMIEPEPARALHRQEIREQRAVEQVDGERAAADIGAARLVVARPARRCRRGRGRRAARRRRVRR